MLTKAEKYFAVLSSVYNKVSFHSGSAGHLLPQWSHRSKIVFSEMSLLLAVVKENTLG